MNRELEPQPIPNEGDQPEPVHDSTEDWSIPQPEKIPLPTYMPIAFALGVTFLFWGFASNLILSAAGLLTIIISITYWMKGVHDEH